MILTVTINPSIDVSCEAPAIRHTHKVRTSAESYAPGGGGINVARVLARLGAEVEACYFAGGITGPVLEGLLARENIGNCRMEIDDDTRMSFTVLDRSLDKEFRFVPDGPPLDEADLARMEARVAGAGAEWLVLSGSLQQAVAPDLYVRLKQAAGERTKAVLDTSGEALKRALAAGGWALVKPSLGELAAVIGRELDECDVETVGAEAVKLVNDGAAERIAVTMGHRGALLATAAGYEFLPALPVEARSAVGAGDSFTAGMVAALARGADDGEAFRMGLAAGTAAVLSPGTSLAHADDVARFFRQLQGANPG